jgi:uncharacterized membrane protein required for colicin V production
MWIDLVTLLVLALAAWRGWRRGTVPVALQLIGVVGGYMGGLMLYRPVGAMLTRVWSVPPMLAAPLGGMLAFFLVSLALRIVSWKVNAILALRRAAGWAPSQPDRAGGAVLATLWAFAIIVAVAWALMAVRSFTNRGPQVAESLTGRVTAWATRRVAYAATRRLAGDPLVANMMSFLAADPQRGAAALRTLMSDQRLRSLFTDATLREALASGDAAAIAGSPAVRALAGDPALREAARDAGLVSGEAGSEAVARDLAARAAPLARTIETMRSDPELQRVLRDPSVQQKLTEGNIDALIADPAVGRVVARMLELLREGSATAP